MANTVQLSITLDNSGALVAVNQTGAAIKNLGTQAVASSAEATAAQQKQAQAIAEVNARMAQALAERTAAATAAAAAEAQAAAQLKAQEAAAKRAAAEFQGMTSAQMRANVAGRLLEQTFGIQNRALNQVMARSSALGPIMSGLFNVAIFTAAANALVMIGEKIASISQAMGGYTAEVKKMEQETIKANEQNFLNPKTLEDTRAHLSEVNAILMDNAKKQNMSLGDRLNLIEQETTLWDRVLAKNVIRAAQEIFTNKTVQEGMQLEQQRAALIERETEQIKKMNEEAAKSAESTALIGKKGFALIGQENANAHMDITRKKQAGEIGDTQATVESISADAKSAAQRLELERNVTEQTIAMRHQVEDETLHGTEKIRADEAYSIEQLTKLRQKSEIDDAAFQQRSVLIHQKAQNQITDLNRQQAAETQALQNKAVLSGLEGDAKIIEATNQEVQKERDLYARGLIDYDTYSARIVAIDQVRNNELVKSAEETEKKKEEALAKHTAFMEQSVESIKDAESATALATVDDWHKAYAQIAIEENKRIAAIDQAERKASAEYKNDGTALIEATQVAQAKRQQVWAETNEKILAEHKKQVQALGADLQSVFDDIGSGNIGKRILDNMKKLFFQILAAWILSLNTMKSGAGSILGSLVFGPGSAGEGAFGGGSSGGLGSLLGLLGLGSSANASGGTSGISPAGSAQGGISSLFGGGTSGTPSTPSIFGASAATGISPSSASTLAGLGLGGLTGGPASTALTTDSLSSSLSGGPGVGVPGTLSGTVTNSGGLLGGLKSLGSLNSLAGIAAFALPLLGGKFGGTIGQIGGMVGGLGLLLSSGALTAAGGGLLGFGVGMQNGKLAGGLSGTASGALMGFLVGGPVGAIIGGLVGLLGGIFGGLFGGSKRKKQANQFADQLLPQVQAVEDAYKSFQVDQPGAISQLEALRKQAEASLKSLKGEGKSVLDKRVEPAIDQAEKDINSFNADRLRRAGLSFGPAQFHDGGLVNAATSAFTTKPGEMMALLKHGEFVVNPQATAKNVNALQKMNAGGGSGGNSGSEIHLHIHTMDAASFQGWAKRGGAQMISDSLGRLRSEGR